MRARTLTAFQRALFVSCGVLLMGAADRGAPLGRVSAPRAASGAVASLWPEFVLFGWVSPPVDVTTPERLAELAGCGLTVALPAWADSGRLTDNAARLAFAAAAGVRGLTWDHRLARVVFGTLEGDALLDSVAADYRDRDGFLGWYFTDEPLPPEFASLAQYHAALRARDPAHPSFNNLLGRGTYATRAEWLAYVREYIDVVHPTVLCADHYDMTVQGDRGLFIENAAGLQSLAREYGIPFWAIVQVIAHGNLRPLSIGEIRWQVSVLLAYGARGVGYFTYWTPPPDPVWNWQEGAIRWDGTRTAHYDMLAAINQQAQPVGVTLARLTWMSTTFSGDVPLGGTGFVPDAVVQSVEGRAAIGTFLDSLGTRHLLIANRDSITAREVSITLHGVTSAELLGGAPGIWSELPLMFAGDTQRLDATLAPGAFVLVRLAVPDDGGMLAGNGPWMSAAPNPANTDVRFTLDRVAGGARLEIMDAGGRRVWSAVPVPGASSIVWNGELERGGRARAGVYFARLEDARGVVAQRIAWLGGQ